MLTTRRAEHGVLPGPDPRTARALSAGRVEIRPVKSSARNDVRVGRRKPEQSLHVGQVIQTGTERHRGLGSAACGVTGEGQ
jgi:hypothetical protein